MTAKQAIKIAYIGGGSRGWAHGLMEDLALTAAITGELVLYDIDHPAAAQNVRVGEKIFAHPDAKTRFRVRAAARPDAALKHADFVVMSIEPGPMRMRYADLVIPAKYGILQPVGDSTGPGGILRGMRACPVYMEYAHRIMEQCPNAWVINYTNPMTLCTTALYAAEPAIKAFGCCHEVFGIQDYLAGLAQRWFGGERPARHDVRLDIAGVNHFTMATAASCRGHDLMPPLQAMITPRSYWNVRTKKALARKREKRWFDSDHRIATDFLRRFGVLGAAGDRHLAEFVPWYLESEAELHRWGAILTPYAYRIEMEENRRKNAGTWDKERLHGTGEEGVRQILALLGLAALDTNVNLPNRGQMPQAPAGAVVETYAQFRRDTVTPIVAGPLPPAAWSLVERIIRVQQLTIAAARAKDKDLAFQALLLDPLVALPTDRAHAMFTTMCSHAAAELPGWK